MKLLMAHVCPMVFEVSGVKALTPDRGLRLQGDWSDVEGKKGALRGFRSGQFWVNA
jgi:hypothetical protein